MKLATFEIAGAPRVGILDLKGRQVTVVDIPDMRSLFEQGPVVQVAAALSTKQTYRLDEIRLRAPIAPKKFFHTAGNFQEHADEGKQSNWVQAIKPWIVFFQNVDAIIGPDDNIVYPEHLTRELDYELELTVVLGKAGKHFGVDQASEYVGGYLIFNDITARDIQRREMESANFCFSKSIDTFCPIGPYIVTPDEIPNPRALKMELRVNGEIRQSSNSGNMKVTIPEIIAHYSALGYSAGDLISTGTVSGVAGFSQDPAAWYLKPGDKIEAEIEGLGILRNQIVSWRDAHGSPPPPPLKW